MKEHSQEANISKSYITYYLKVQYVLKDFWELGIKNELSRGWRKRHNDKLWQLYDRPEIIQTLKFQRLKWARRIIKGGLKINGRKENLFKGSKKVSAWKEAVEGNIGGVMLDWRVK